jgi:hypothetical protein
MIEDFAIRGRAAPPYETNVRADDGKVLASYRNGMNGWAVKIGCDHDVYVASDAHARIWLAAVAHTARQANGRTSR